MKQFTNEGICKLIFLLIFYYFRLDTNILRRNFSPCMTPHTTGREEFARPFFGNKEGGFLASVWATPTPRERFFPFCDQLKRETKGKSVSNTCHICWCCTALFQIFPSLRFSFVRLSFLHVLIFKLDKLRPNYSVARWWFHRALELEKTKKNK